jgi:hypothetical protein
MPSREAPDRSRCPDDREDDLGARPLLRFRDTMVEMGKILFFHRMTIGCAFCRVNSIRYKGGTSAGCAFGGMGPCVITMIR